jgi:bilirubin oxidase
MPTIRSVAYVLSAVAGQVVSAKDWDSPAYNYLYQFPMPIAPIKVPKNVYNFPNAPTIEYYEIDIKPFEQQVYPNLGKTRLVGYDGMVPGPTFKVKKGTEAVVRFINHSDRTNSVHLHGSYSRAPFDGWADDTTAVGQYKDYYYPNAQNARTLWYHDHAIDHTAENAYMGQAGFYIMHDDEEQLINGLPQGDYDIPIALTSKRYNADGTLWSPEKNKEEQNLFGDVVHVNGQPWPYFKVEPRKYRLRFLNAAISRSWELYFEPSAKVGTKLNMKVVGSDAGLLTKPVDTTQLDISMAERWEVVFDFSGYKNQNVTLRSNAKVADVDPYLHTDKVMRFVVGDTVTSDKKNEALPNKLRDVPFPPNKVGLDHSFEFQRTGSEWKINGVTWADGPEARVMAKPKRGAVERWSLKNGSGG